MNINSVNKMHPNFNGAKIDSNMNDIDKPLKDTMSELYSKVRQELPEKGSYDSINLPYKDRFTGGDYLFTVREFGNEGKSSLRLSYIHNNGKSARGVGLIEGTKQDILDYLGNERNIPRINYYIDDLKDSVDKD